LIIEKTTAKGGATAAQETTGTSGVTNCRAVREMIIIGDFFKIRFNSLQ
jgi:hypothetical protein